MEELTGVLKTYGENLEREPAATSEDDYDAWLNSQAAQAGLTPEAETAPVIKVKPVAEKKLPGNSDAETFAGAGEFAQAAAKGIPKAAENVINGAITLGDYAENTLAKFGIGKGNLIEDKDRVQFVDKSEDPSLQMVTDVASYAVPFGASMKIANMGWKAATATSAAIDFFGTDPKGERLSNLLMDHTKLKNVALAHDILGFLQKKPGESEMEARTKNMLEGVLFGGAIALGAEGVIKGFKGAKAARDAVKAARAAKGLPKEAEAFADSAKMVFKGKDIADETNLYIKEVAKTPDAAELPSEALALANQVDEVPEMTDDVANFKLDSAEHVSPQVDEAGAVIDVSPDLKNEDAVTALTNYVSSRKPNVPEYVPTTFDKIDNDAKNILASAEQRQVMFDKINSKQELSASEITAANYLAQNTTRELIKAAKMVSENSSDVNVANFIQIFDAHRNIHSGAEAAESVAGLNLNATKIASNLGNTPMAEVSEKLLTEHKGRLIKKMIQYSGGNYDNVSMANKIAALSDLDPAALETIKEIKAGPIRKYADALDNIAINGMLSSGKTISGIALSQGVITVRDTVNNYTAAGINMFRSTQGTDVGYSLAQANRFTGNLFSSMGESFINMAKSLKEGKAVSPAKIDFKFNINTISGEALGYEADSLLSGVANTVGTVVGIPQRVNTSVDSFFGTMNYRAKIGELAQEQAEKLTLANGLTKAEATEVYNKLRKSPTKNMHEMAKDYAERTTFSKKFSSDMFPTSKTTNTVENSLNYMAGGVLDFAQGIQNTPVLRVWSPFLNASMNGIHQAFTNSPMAILAPGIRRSIMAGGKEGNLAAARVLNSVTFLGVAAYLGASGVTTGQEPENFEVKKALDNNKGWQPDSLVINGEFYSYRRMDAIAPALRLGNVLARLRDNMDDLEFDQLMYISAGAMADTVTPEMLVDSYGTFFEGMTDLMEGKKQDAFEKNMANLAARYIPYSALGKDISAMDGDKLDTSITKNSLDVFTDTLVNKYKAINPYFNKDLPPVTNMFGETVVAPPGAGPLINPMPTISGEKDDVVTRRLTELSQYYELHKDVIPITPLSVNMPPRAVEMNGVTVDLTPQEYYRYVQYCNGPDGAKLKDVLKDILEVDYDILKSKDLTEAVYNKVTGKLGSVIRNYRDNGEKMMMQDPEFLDRVVTKRLNKANNPLKLNLKE